MQLDDLISDFCHDIKTIAYEQLLDALDIVTSPAVKARPKVVRRRPAKKVAPVQVKEAPPPVPVGVPVKEYLPPVSDEILQAVYGALDLSTGKSSRVIATEIKRGETAVRVALKHLVKRGVSVLHRAGKNVFYSDARSWKVDLKDFP